MFTMENCFYVLISQAVRCLKDPSILPRDKQRLKQELSSELVRHLISLNLPLSEVFCILLNKCGDNRYFSWQQIPYKAQNGQCFLITTLHNINICIGPSLCFQSTLLSSLSRHFRRGSPSSPASGLLPSTQSKPSTPGSKGSHEGQEPFIQLVQAFVRLVQR